MSRIFRDASLTVLFLCLAVPRGLLAERVDEGITFYQAGKYQEAEAVLRGVSGEEPENARARYYLGLTLLELEKYAEAATELKEAERILVKSDEGAAVRRDQVKVGLARAQMELKEYDDAQASLNEAQELNPQSSEVFLYRGKLGLHREDYANAAKALDKAIALEPKQAYSHYYAGIAYSNLKRPDKMVDHFQMFLKLAPDAPEAKKVRSLLRSVR